MVLLHDSLSSALTQRIEILELSRNEPTGNYAWQLQRRCWAAAEQDVRSNLFSSAGVGARGVTFTVRADTRLTMFHAIRWNGLFCFLTALIPAPDRMRTAVRAAVCEPRSLTARPVSRSGRDSLNRPVLTGGTPFSFPGILTELYYRNEPQEVQRVLTIQRVLVTPKVIVLRPGDLVEDAGAKYTVRQILDLDPYKNEYVMERQEDA